MFGLDTITGTKFTTMLLLLCSVYYAAVFIRVWAQPPWPEIRQPVRECR